MIGLVILVRARVRMFVPEVVIGRGPRRRAPGRRSFAAAAPCCPRAPAWAPAPARRRAWSGLRGCCRRRSAGPSAWGGAPRPPGRRRGGLAPRALQRPWRERPEIPSPRPSPIRASSLAPPSRPLPCRASDLSPWARSLVVARRLLQDLLHDRCPRSGLERLLAPLPQGVHRMPGGRRHRRELDKRLRFGQRRPGVLFGFEP